MSSGVEKDLDFNKRDSTVRDSLYEHTGLEGNLFFQVGKEDEEDELRELGELQRGIDYPATYIVSESTGKYREITMTLSLSGVKVSEPLNKKRSREFQIEQIVQYSYSRPQSRFNFAYLEADGALTNYRFIAKEFFSIHQTLGTAISLMVKIKNNEFTPEMLARAAKYGKLDSESLANSDNTLTGGQGSNEDNIQRVSSMESISSNSVISKASLTKYYMENKYKNIEKSNNESLKPLQETDIPPIVIHGGDDENESHEVADKNDQSPIALQESTDEDTTAEANSNDSDFSKVKKKEKSGKGSLRGWSLFGTQRRKGGNELTSIEEQGHSTSESRLHVVTEGTMGKNLEKRRKSIQEIFGKSVDQTADIEAQRNRLGSSTLVEASASTSSLDSTKEKDLPPVDKKYDQWGREILIKNAKGGKYDITAGTVEALVECLAEEAPPDTIYIEMFLLTFRHFMTPVQLLKLLRQRFLAQTESDQTNSIIRVRVISVLKKWAERHYYDFRFPEVQQALQEVLEDIGRTECAKYGTQIKSIIDSEMERAKTFVPPGKPVVPKEVQRVLDNIDFVTYWNPKKIAQEITLEDIRLFRLIKPDEFCIFLWGDKNDTKISNFNNYINRFNRIGFWVGTVICMQRDIKRRVELIEKFIQILKYLNKYQNYSSLMAIHSGLNTTAVSRLKKTWEIVNKGRYNSVYKDIEAKMSYRGNFKSYREIEAMAKPPFIPFFGLYVKDLTFMNDGNQKHVVLMTSTKKTEENETSTETSTIPPMSPIINFEKCRSINDKIHALRVFQQSTYKFEEEKDDKQDGFFSTFVNSPGTDEELKTYFEPPFGPPAIDDEKQLLAMSRDCEPSERSSHNNNSNNYTIGSTSAKESKMGKEELMAGGSVVDTRRTSASVKS